VQLIQILSVQLTQILYTNAFGAAYIFGSLYFWCSLIDQAAYTWPTLNVGMASHTCDPY
jgi:hypothetical protein